MFVLDFGVITDETKVGILCTTLGQAEMLIDAVKIQRPDINTGDWPKLLRSETHANRAYFLNYRNSKRLQHGDPKHLPDGLTYIPFEALLMDDFPNIDANKTGILSLLGL